MEGLSKIFLGSGDIVGFIIQDYSSRQDTARFRYSMWHPFTSAEVSRIIPKDRICYIQILQGEIPSPPHR